MADALTSPAPALEELSASLVHLKAALQPLLSQPFDELVEKLEAGSSVKLAEGEEAKDELAGTLDAARLRVSVAYVLLDAVWMYLKAKGVDPATHPVLGELERVKSYFAKIKHAQSHGKEQERTHVDKSAAARFIRAALAGAGAGDDPAARAAAAPALQGVHKRFDFEQDESSGSDDSGDGKEKGKAAAASAKKRRKSEEDDVVVVESKSKRGRKAMDPFVGYDESSRKTDAHPLAAESALASAPASSSPASKKDKKKKHKSKSK